MAGKGEKGKKGGSFKKGDKVVAHGKAGEVEHVRTQLGTAVVRLPDGSSLSARLSELAAVE